ncbi:MAG: glycosyltransferase family 4 protein, partial [Planctomycetaceae bacterium]|nr:glycosyltransferase family 4 protein [Planctomycetaceae bacterium]
CGTPAIGTAVGGIQDELQNKDLGLLIPERSAEAIGKVANQALQRDWNRPIIAEKLKERTWEATAQRVAEVLQEAVLC